MSRVAAWRDDLPEAVFPEALDRGRHPTTRTDPQGRFTIELVGKAPAFVLLAEAPGFRIQVPQAQTGNLKPYKGQRVTLGIRPEDLHVAGGGDAPQHTFDAVVDVVEPLGSEILLDVKAGTSTLVARVEPTVRAKVHEQVRLAMNPERLHFFDTKTEQAI